MGKTIIFDLGPTLSSSHFLQPLECDLSLGAAGVIQGVCIRHQRESVYVVHSSCFQARQCCFYGFILWIEVNINKGRKSLLLGCNSLCYLTTIDERSRDRDAVGGIWVNDTLTHNHSPQRWRAKTIKVLILHQQTKACNASLTCTGSTYTKISVSLQSISSNSIAVPKCIHQITSRVRTQSDK